MNEGLHRQIITKVSQDLGVSLNPLYLVAYQTIEKVTLNPLSEPTKYLVSQTELKDGLIVSVSDKDSGLTLSLKRQGQNTTLSVVKVLATEYQAGSRFYT